MTLNITLLTETTIYLSADFRLWDPRLKRPITNPSTKAVTLENFEWNGFLTYAGIGQWHGRDTSEWVIGWLKGRSNLSFDEAVEVVRTEGAGWLKRITAASAKRWHHTFVAAAFVDGIARAAVISNFEGLGRAARKDPTDVLEVSTASTTSKPKAIVTGCVTPPISREQRRVLEQLAARHGNDPGRIRRAMQELNRSAAQTQPRLISEDCSVESFDRHGRGVHGGAVQGAAPRIMFEGTDLGSLLEQAANDIFEGKPYRVVGGSSASSRSTGIDIPACEPVVSDLPATSAYRMVDLLAQGRSGIARAVNAEGVIVGESTAAGHGPVLPCRWVSNGDLDFLKDLGGITGQALGVNSRGTLTGTIEDPDRASHACTWNQQNDLNLLVIDGARRSGARPINQRGDVVGWVSFHPTDGGQQHYRPSFWGADGSIRVLEDMPAEWGYATATNDSGSVLVCGYEGMRIFPLLWEGDDAELLIDASSMIFPVAIDNSRRVLGWTRQRDQLEVALVWEEATGWRRLGTDPGWFVTGMNNNGAVVGYRDVHGYRRPWIARIDEDPRFLPHYAYHNTQPEMIDDSGAIAGAASTDHGSHPLVWVPETETKPPDIGPAGSRSPINPAPID